MQNLVDILLARWNSLPAAEQPPHLGERLEELFLEASMLEAVSTPLAAQKTLHLGMPSLCRLSSR